MTELKLWRIPLYHYHYRKPCLFAFAETEERALELIREDLAKEGLEEDTDYDFGCPEHWDVEESVIDPYYDL